jgi:hypothetical protein
MRMDIKVERATTASRLFGVVFALGAAVQAAGPLQFLNSLLHTLIQFILI